MRAGAHGHGASCTAPGEQLRRDFLLDRPLNQHLQHDRDQFVRWHVLKRDLQLVAGEREVLRHMAEGRSNAGIGQALHLAARTVEAHVAGVFAKLDLPAGADDNRRVLAVVTWMRASADDPADH